MPPGGDGVYYFSTYVLVDDGEIALLDMTLNDDIFCSTYPDHSHNGDGDFVPGSCSAIMDVVTGKQCLISVLEQLEHLKTIVSHLTMSVNDFIK